MGFVCTGDKDKKNSPFLTLSTLSFPPFEPLDCHQGGKNFFLQLLLTGCQVLENSRSGMHVFAHVLKHKREFLGLKTWTSLTEELKRLCCCFSAQTSHHTVKLHAIILQRRPRLCHATVACFNAGCTRAALGANPVDRACRLSFYWLLSSLFVLWAASIGLCQSYKRATLAAALLGAFFNFFWATLKKSQGTPPTKNIGKWHFSA